jgi:hypothetical protein
MTASITNTEEHSFTDEQKAQYLKDHSITAAARAEAKSELESQFQYFLRDATPEEMYFLHRVLNIHFNGSNPDHEVCGIANAFLEAVGLKDLIVSQVGF